MTSDAGNDLDNIIDEINKLSELVSTDEEDDSEKQEIEAGILEK